MVVEFEDNHSYNSNTTTFIVKRIPLLEWELEIPAFFCVGIGSGHCGN